MLSKNTLIETFSNQLPKLDSESELFFEHLSLDGLEEMHQYSKDERLYEFFEFEPFKQISETKEYIQKLLQRMSGQFGEKSTKYWFVRRRSDNRLVGTATLVNLNYTRQSIEWGYGVDPELWGNGYVLKIQEILKHYVFEVLEFNRLSGITMVTNERTIQSVLASGMKHEGILRDYYCKNETFYDGWQYGMVAKDYFLKSTSSKVTVSINEVISVVSSVLTEEDITDNSSMENTFSWDSLNHMDIVVALKEKFIIEISHQDINTLTSIKKIFNKISTLHEKLN